MSAQEQNKRKLLFISNRWVNTIYTDYGVVKQKILLQIIEQLQEKIIKVMRGTRVSSFGILPGQEILIDLDMSRIYKYNNYHQVRKAIKQMSDNAIKIYNDPSFKTNIYYMAPLLSGYEPTKEKRIVQVAIKKNIAELLLFVDYGPSKKKQGEYVAKQFTPLDVNSLQALTSKYYFPIYTMMASWATTGGFTIDIEELRERLQVEEKYKGFDNFHRYVLKHVQKEMQISANYSFNFTLIKTGKVVKKIAFKIFSNAKQDPNHAWLKIYRALNEELPYFMKFTEEQRAQFNYLLTGKYDLEAVHKKLQYIHSFLVKKKQQLQPVPGPRIFLYTLEAIEKDFPPG